MTTSDTEPSLLFDVELDEPAGDDESSSGFEVHLVNFEGPFDLLLTLIAKHKLDVTELALHQVTDEFIAYIKDVDWDLDEASQFLLVAATLLDLKAARLLPSGEVEDEDDLALLEARDLLFARLLQYKAYKEITAVFSARLAEESLRYPRAVGLDERYASLLPEVVVGLGPHELAQLAAKVLTPRPEPTVGLTHLHEPRVSVREQAVVVVDRLRASRQLTFRALAADCPSTTYVIARFLALLELYRERVIAFEQLTPLGDLTIRWTGDDDDDAPIGVSDEFDTPNLAAGETTDD
ncbi:segregation and condensation protein A [Phytoactinopolyspora limicola]|uniref:segregation and condensation protein A n=1 Tax=Phytoactinopolyspora limicola TaxID=2715536 RepID=UPI001FE732D0|nr:segregation/condensation protein A [Phytoactinopolyspora limicola]